MYPSSVSSHLLTPFLFAILVAGQNTTNNLTEKNQYQAEIECYGLPYGAAGFVSHLLTYYTMAAYVYGRKPLAPWLRLSGTSRQKPYLIGGKLLFTTVSSVASIASCDRTWPFVTLAVMKLSLSLSFSATSALQHKGATLIYLPGGLAGLTGAFALAASDMSDSGMKFITGFFWGMAGIASFCLMICMFMGLSGKNVGNTVRLAEGGIICLMGWSALYTDWVLMQLGGISFIGFPYESMTWIKFMWVLYVIGERLTLFVT